MTGWVRRSGTGFRARSRSPRGWRRGLFWLALAAGLLLVAEWLEFRVRPLVAAAARATATRVATEALSNAVTAEVAEHADADSLVHVESEGRDLQLARVNLAGLTRLQTQATQRAESALRAVGQETLYVRMGQLSGAVLAASIGPSIPVHVQLMSAVHSSITADVQSVGVNQTVHIFYLDLTAQVEVMAPLMAQPVNLRTRVPVAYVVFVGKVPQSYWGPSAPAGVAGASH